MKRNEWVSLLVGSMMVATTSRAEEVGTAFTYQGFIEKPAGTAVTDTCTFEFALCDDAVAACAPGTVSSHPGIEVTDGVFIVPDIDFGMGAFTGETRWMEIKVQCSSDVDFVAFSPRVELTPAPYALRAVEGVGPPTGIHVTSDGDVGIGTTTPAAQLDVNGAARATTVEITGGSPLLQPLVGWGQNTYGETNIPSGTFIAVAAGSGYSLAIRSDGKLVGWGLNSFGQINVPVGTYTVVAAGDQHCIAIRTDGTLIGWGSNGNGQTDVPFGTFTAVAAGGSHSLGIRNDGTLVGWGWNGYGQINVPGGEFAAAAAGWGHSLAIRSDGTLAGWGVNHLGQTNIPSGTFVAVAAGAGHSLAIRRDGTLIGWGENTFGEINVPAGIFIAVAAGYQFSLALRADGTLVGWGRNTEFEINVPAGTFTAIAAGQLHALAINTNAPGSGPALLLHSDSAYKPGSNTWTIYSDRRLKKNITPLSGALDRLLQLRGVTFNWRDPASQGGITGTQMGLIADEVQRVFPQWVGRDPRGYQTLTVGGFEALTAEALRDLRAEKDRQLAEMQKRNAEMEARLRHLEELLAPSSRQEGERP